MLNSGIVKTENTSIEVEYATYTQILSTTYADQPRNQDF